MIVPLLILCMAAIYQLILDYQASMTVEYAVWRGARSAVALIPRRFGPELPYTLQEGGDKWEQIQAEVVHALIPVSSPSMAHTWPLAFGDTAFFARVAAATALGADAEFYLARYGWATSHSTMTFHKKNAKSGSYEPMVPDPKDGLLHFEGADEDITLRVVFEYREIFPVAGLVAPSEESAGQMSRLFEITSQATLPLQGEMFPHLKKPEPGKPQDESLP